MMKKIWSIMILALVMCSFTMVSVSAVPDEQDETESMADEWDESWLLGEEGDLLDKDIDYLTTSEGATIPVERQKPRLVDDADLLSDREESRLLEKLDNISEKNKCDVAIVTVYSLDEKTATAYADDYFDYNGYGYGTNDDGVLFLISMEKRDWAISTYGYGITALTDAGQQRIMQECKPYLSKGDYSEAFNIFADRCDEFIASARNGKIIDVDTLPKEPFPVGKNLLIALLIGAVVGAFAVMSMMAKLKSVHLQSSAVDYVKPGSLNVTQRNDIYLYRTVNRTKIESSSGGSHSGGSHTHHSSSGRSHGGSSGKF